MYNIAYILRTRPGPTSTPLRQDLGLFDVMHLFGRDEINIESEDELHTVLTEWMSCQRNNVSNHGYYAPL